MVKKGQIVINPQTSRPVKVGSRTWLKLVKDGIFEGSYDDPNQLYEYDDSEDDEMIEIKKRQLNKNLPKNKQAVKGRGKHKNKLVVRNKRLKPQEIADYTAKNAVKVMSKNRDNLENMTDAEIEEKLQELINREMLRSETTQKPVKKSKMKVKKCEFSESEYSESESESEYSELEF